MKRCEIGVAIPGPYYYYNMLYTIKQIHKYSFTFGHILLKKKKKKKSFYHIFKCRTTHKSNFLFSHSRFTIVHQNITCNKKELTEQNSKKTEREREREKGSFERSTR